MTLPTAPKSQGQFYIWMYDSSAQSWTNIGLLSVSGTSISFGGDGPSVTLKSGVVYVAIPFTAAPQVTCPTPGPTPTPGPVPLGPKLYATGGGSGIRAYDDQGDQLNPIGGFPTLKRGFGITFDSANQQLYITDAQNNLVTSYDENGNPIATRGGFPNLNDPGNIAFDQANNRLYVADADTIKVYDAAGNRITTSGAFPNYAAAAFIAVDPLARRLFVTKILSGPVVFGTVLAYDEDGNQVSTSGSFTIAGEPTGIALDAVNRRIYVGWQPVAGTNVRGMVSVFDENGNQIPTSGTFDDGNSLGISLAFDRANGDLYIGSGQLAPIRVFDANGNRVLTQSIFQNSAGIVDITFVP